MKPSGHRADPDGFEAFDGSASKFLTGSKVRLRPLESGDLEFLYLWENDPDVWQYGDCGFGTEAGAGTGVGAETEVGVGVGVGTDADADAETGAGVKTSGKRFSREALKEFIKNQQHSIHITKQLRFVICCPAPSDTLSDALSDTPVGFIDLFDFDPVELRAGVGILICDPVRRRRGYGRGALELILEYAYRVLGLREVWCNVAADNRASIALFSGAGFERNAILSDSYVMSYDLTHGRNKSGMQR